MCGQSSQREMAQRSLIAFPEQVKDARALREVVIGLGNTVQPRMNFSAQAEAFSPGPRAFARVEALVDSQQSLLSLSRTAGLQQGLTGDEFGLDGFRGRRAR